MRYQITVPIPQPYRPGAETVFALIFFDSAVGKATSFALRKPQAQIMADALWEDIRRLRADTAEEFVRQLGTLGVREAWIAKIGQSGEISE